MRQGYAIALFVWGAWFWREAEAIGFRQELAWMLLPLGGVLWCWRYAERDARHTAEELQ